MRIFIYPSAPDCANLGDVAMLQIALERLRELWPGASFSVLMRAPEAFKNHCPGVKLVSARGCKYWLRQNASRRPGFLFPLRKHQVQEFAEALFSSDLLVLTGAGILTDAFQDPEARVLNTFKAAIGRGIPTAMVGQGVGPIRNEILLACAAEVLPRVGALFLREPCASLSLLRQLKVPEERIAVTGDDAIELAFRERRFTAGSCIGVNLRVAGYAGLRIEIARRVHEVLVEKARQYQTNLVGIPITNGSRDSDVRTLERWLPGGSVWNTEEAWKPATVIRRISDCRLVVAGSYHAGVFALSQGIPAVTIVESQYYANKFEGLAAQFGCGYAVQRADDPQFAGHLSAAVDRAWRESDLVRPELLNAAERQIAAGREAYARLPALVASRTGTACA